MTDHDDTLTLEERASNRAVYTRRVAWTTALHLLLAGIALTLVLPFIWMVLTSLKELEEVGLESWLPRVFQWSNYREVFHVEGILFGRWYWNSVFVAASVTFLQVLTSSLAAFSFSRLDWPGRDRVFLLYLATMMLPGLVMMIPNYQVMIKLGLVDSYLGLIIPASFSAFGTFLLRQFMMSIPRSLDEAAEIDGASKWQLFWDVILPLARPGLITLGIFTFIGNYHSFFWPLVVLKSTHRYTLPIGLLFFDSSQGQQTNLMMAAITMSVIPMILIFVLLQKQLVKGIQLGAVKG
ncbi:MAG: carbohydrate ABC transporter permease [Lentisphaerae bacterium]|jgi:multiple sugar transport system permease protein|nr:carbohydrate ABC transporter permease [Lentisphaerota bacterium]MBT4818447.1 carbohydrate ABC transporter permease [Lentisphaerota bacterium]MBT5605942.1 carbohydrate ABC transporter permease [Lentisphaerota bacterium]MBT7058021.1 carbohydrate ABC transporter permease [Lentisphaerota bacterium]MBT7848576.1 carbohydrate ABC transporter permease [Lentisphaerota bacterium]